MAELILQLLALFTPIVRDVLLAEHAKTGQMPTDAEVQAIFRANIDRILAEGAAWKAQHPRPSPWG